MADDDLGSIERVRLGSGKDSVSMSGEEFHRHVERVTTGIDVARVESMLQGDVYPVPDKNRFIEHEFIAAPDLEMLGEAIVEHFDMAAASMFDIAYLWKAAGTKRAGAKCSKASGALRFYSKADFVIWVGAEGPRAHLFTLRQIRALLYHELLHISATEKGEPALRDHDAEVFREELREFGMWHPEYERAFGQLELPIFGGAASEGPF